MWFFGHRWSDLSSLYIRQLKEIVKDYLLTSILIHSEKRACFYKLMAQLEIFPCARVVYFYFILETFAFRPS